RLLLAAYAEVVATMPDAPDLLLAGIAPPTAADRQYSESLGISARGRGEGGVTRERLCEFYRNAALFVPASAEEGLGIVLLEAMACGLPVVATRCGGPETVVVPGETGLLTPVGNPRALAEGILALLRDRARGAQMGRRGRERIEARFSLA